MKLSLSTITRIFSPEPQLQNFKFFFFLGHIQCFCPHNTSCSFNSISVSGLARCDYPKNTQTFLDPLQAKFRAMNQSQKLLFYSFLLHSISYILHNCITKPFATSGSIQDINWHLIVKVVLKKKKKTISLESQKKIKIKIVMLLVDSDEN